MLLKSINEYSGIYLACGYTDLRKSVDGLMHIVKQDFEMDPFGNYLFLFCNRNRNRMKGLCWDGNGFWLCYKRLDGMGAKFVWPGLLGRAATLGRPASKRSLQEASGVCDQPVSETVRDISVSQLELLMHGMSVDPPKGFGEITARDF